jgi:flagellar assembly factor FliW
MLPDYIFNLIHSDNVTIQITPIDHYKVICVKTINIESNYFDVTINEYDGEIYNFFWLLTGERKDIPKLITEV